MGDVLDRLSDAASADARRRSQPQWTRPMLATLTHEPFSDPAWIYERKLDGERCLVFRDGDGVHLMSRNRKALDDTYPELQEAAAQLGCDRYIADGEIVTFDGRVTSFSRLQGRIGITDRKEARASGIRVHLYLFDVMHADGYDLTHVALRDRKRVLRAMLDGGEAVRFTPHRNGDGLAYLREACEKRWEGLIAKRADSPYRHSRSNDWLKFKCGHRQEFVITGFTEPQGRRVGFGALVLGYYRRGDLVYAGRVGTGFDNAFLRDLRRKMDRLERKTTPLNRAPSSAGGNGVHWLTPKLVGEVAFTEWTRDGRLRHPRFIGLRDDKNPREVTRERPEG